MKAIVGHDTHNYVLKRAQENERKQAFTATLAAGKSQSPAISATGSMDAALWLLSLEHVGQALFLMCQTIEVALKGLLEEISPLTVVDRLEWTTIKGLLRDKIQNHRLRQEHPNTCEPSDLLSQPDLRA